MRWIFLCLILLIFHVSMSQKVIPNVLFRSYDAKLLDLHPKFVEIFSVILKANNEFSMVYFDSKERIRFIRTFFPQYLDGYNSLIPGAFKNDIWRLLMLYRYGGVYSDMGIQFVKNIREIVLSNASFVSVVDLDPRDILNSFIAAYPQHPLIKKMIEVIMDNVNNRRYNCNFLDITGPKALGRAYRAFFGDFAPVDIPIGSFARQNFTFHFLSFNAIPTQTMKNDKGELCIRNKFEGYKNLIYKNHTTMPYNELYSHHKVFHDDAMRDRNKDVFFRNYLYRNGLSFRYVFDGRKEFMFPNYDTFLAMGFENCMTSREHAPEQTTNLTKEVLPADVLESVYLLNLWGRTNCSHHNDSQDGFSYLSFPSVNANIQSLRSHAEPLQVMNFSRFIALIEVDALNVPGVKDTLLID